MPVSLLMYVMVMKGKGKLGGRKKLKTKSVLQKTILDNRKHFGSLQLTSKY